jgi:hypothetical protein
VSQPDEKEKAEPRRETLNSEIMGNLEDRRLCIDSSRDRPHLQYRRCRYSCHSSRNCLLQAKQERSRQFCLIILKPIPRQIL